MPEIGESTNKNQSSSSVTEEITVSLFRVVFENIFSTLNCNVILLSYILIQNLKFNF